MDRNFMHHALASVFLATLPSTALAAQPQPDPQASNSQDDESGGVRDTATTEGVIIVTARKREESLQDVPLSIVALDADAIEQTKAADLAGLSGKIPNVVLDPAPAYSNGAAFSIRGISFQDPDASFEPAVGVVLNGVFLGKATAALLDVNDLEQIEVLRGPQGTLFGKNTIAGLVNVRTKKPSGDFHFGAQATVGNYGRADVNGYIEAPIGDGEVAAFRLFAASRHMDGYFRNAAIGNRRIGAERLLTGRATLVLQPTDNFDLTVVGDYVENDSDPSPQNAVSPDFFVASQLGVPQDDDGDPFQVNYGTLGFIDSKTKGVSVEANLTLPTHTLTSVSGYRRIDDRSQVNLAGTSIDFFIYDRDQKIDQLSQELRIASTWSDWIDYVAGVIYHEVSYDQIGNQQIDCNAIGACPPGGAPLGVVLIPLISNTSQTTKSYAAFLQADVHLTSEFSVTLGGRYNHEVKDFTFTPPGSNLGLFPPPFDQATGHLATDTFTPRVGVNYEPNPDILLFASWARGYKAGGFNGRATSTLGIGPYRDETVDAFEAGLKSEWLNGDLRANITTFYNDYKDMQIETIVPSPFPPGQETIVQNAGKAYTAGVELELVARPIDGLMLHANLGYLKARYTSFIADLNGTGTPINNDDLLLRRAPKWSGDLGAKYDQYLNNDGKIIYDANVNFSSSYETSVTNDAFASRPSAALANASITYESPSRNYHVSLWARNIFDKRYINNGINAGFLFAFNEPNRPRTYGIDVGIDF